MASDSIRFAAVADHLEIIELIIRFAAAFDSQDWAALRACLVDEIDIDYSQLRGEPPSRLSADAYVESRRQGLAGLETLHVSTNHLVTIADDSASCRSTLMVFRVDPAMAAGENRFDTVGRYEHGLIRTAQGWRITRIKQTVLVQEGNPMVHGAMRRKNR
jgi:hypothetical protein